MASQRDGDHQQSAHLGMNNQFYKLLLSLHQLAPTAYASTLMCTELLPAPLPFPSAFSQILGGQCSSQRPLLPKKPHLQRGQVHVLTLNSSLAATNSFGVMNQPLLPGRSQASQSSGVRGRRATEGRVFVREQ